MKKMSNLLLLLQTMISKIFIQGKIKINLVPQAGGAVGAFFFAGGGQKEKK